jgi:hypothetical protein
MCVFMIDGRPGCEGGERRSGEEVEIVHYTLFGGSAKQLGLQVKYSCVKWL